MPDKNINQLITILCSSFHISRYVDEGKGDLSIPDLAIDLSRLEGFYNDTVTESLKEFDGFTNEDIEKSSFQRRLKKLDKKCEELAQVIKRHIPLPLVLPKSLDESNRERSSHLNLQDQIEHELVQKWYHRFALIGGKSCCPFDDSDFIELQKLLQELALYKIKYDAMKEVEDNAALNGQYNFSRTFNNVPDACRWLYDQLEEPTLHYLVEQLRGDRIIIEKDGLPMTDSQKIYNQAYSWYQNLNEKGFDIPLK